MSPESFPIEADWVAPPGIRVVVTQRGGGLSAVPFSSLNLGDHVGDDPAVVLQNRERLARVLGLPRQPQWLHQVHGIEIVDARDDGVVREADAAWTDEAGIVCAVLTADCLPVVLAAADGSELAVAHCGWRGLAGGVLSSSVARFAAPPQRIRAWLGPAIGPAVFEVGAEVREAFLVAQDAVWHRHIDTAFVALAQQPGKFLADIYALARIFLQALGVQDISGGGRCTVTERDLFFSYRRDGVTGRMATLAWIDPEQAKQPLT